MCCYGAGCSNLSVRREGVYRVQPVELAVAVIGAMVLLLIYHAIRYAGLRGWQQVAAALVLAAAVDTRDSSCDGSAGICPADATGGPRALPRRPCPWSPGLRDSGGRAGAARLPHRRVELDPVSGDQKLWDVAEGGEYVAAVTASRFNT